MTEIRAKNVFLVRRDVENVGIYDDRYFSDVSMKVWNYETSDPLHIQVQFQVEYPKCDDKTDNVVRIFNTPGSENRKFQFCLVSIQPSFICVSYIYKIVRI